MKRSSGTAALSVVHSADNKAGRLVHQSSDVENTETPFTTHNLCCSAEQPALISSGLITPHEPPGLQISDFRKIRLQRLEGDVGQKIAKQVEKQDENTAALIAAYELGQASMTTDGKKRKLECAKITMPNKDGVLGMLWTAANNGIVIPRVGWNIPESKTLNEKPAQPVAATNVSAASSSLGSAEPPANITGSAAGERSKPNMDASTEKARWTLVMGDGTDDSTDGASEYSDGTISSVLLGYTPLELNGIEDSQAVDKAGRQKRALVRDSEGRCYTMAGMNRCAGDFTVPAGFRLSEFQKPDFDPRWIRQPDSDDPEKSIHMWTPYVHQPEWDDLSLSSPKEMNPIDVHVCRSQNRYVLEMRKGCLRHISGVTIRSDDTIGMFPGGMTLLFPNTT